MATVVQSKENGVEIALSTKYGLPAPAIPFIEKAHEGTLFRRAGSSKTFAVGATIVDGVVVTDEPQVDELEEATQRINAREAAMAAKAKAEMTKRYSKKKQNGAMHPVARMSRGEDAEDAEAASEDAESET